MRERVSQEIVEKARETLMAPWNINNAFVILWGYGDGSNEKHDNTKGTQNKISFANTEKSQIDSIAKILGMEDKIYNWQPKNGNSKLAYRIRWADQLLSDYLHNMGFRVNKTNIGAHFPGDFPNELMDVGAYGFFLSNGGITRVGKIYPQIRFFAGKEFLTDFQIQLEKHVNFPLGVGLLEFHRKTLGERVDVYNLEYNGRFSFRILSAMFKRTADICWSVKRDKTMDIVSNYTNIALDMRDKAEKPKLPPEGKAIVALYDALDLMDAETKKRYMGHCDEWMDDIRCRAEENWYLKGGK